MHESIDRDKIKKRLREEKQKGSRLVTITAEERKKERYLIYHLDKEDNGELITLEVKLDGNKAERVTDIYENADLYEREAREMFGLDFGEEMRNLFLPEEAEEPPMSTVEEAIKSENKERKPHKEEHSHA